MRHLLGTRVLAIWTLTVQHFGTSGGSVSEGYRKYVLTDAPDLVVTVHEGRLGATGEIIRVSLNETSQAQVAHALQHRTLHI